MAPIVLTGSAPLLVSSGWPRARSAAITRSSPQRFGGKRRCSQAPGCSVTGFKRWQTVSLVEQRAQGLACRATQSTYSLSVEEPLVVCFGEGLFDCLADQRGLPREQVKSWTPYPGGAPANVAAALGKLGSKVVFFSALGDDDLGNELMDVLKGRGVDLSGVQRVSQPTRDVLVIFGGDGDRQFCGFGKAATTDYADCFISADKLPMDTLQKASTLVTGTLGLAYPVTAEAMRKAVAAAKAAHCTVLVDVNWRPVFWQDQDEAARIITEYVKQADLVKLTDEEAEWLFDVPAAEALSHPKQVLAKLPGAQGVLVTAGSSGSGYAFRGLGGEVLAGRVPVLKVEVDDTTGAGDAFLAGFLHAMVKAGGLSALRKDASLITKAVEFGTASGALTTKRPGAIAAQPSLEEVEQLLSTAEPLKV